jgi:hypothetical protein
MNVMTWVLQGVLAAVFLAHGWMMLFPPPDVAVQMNVMLPRWFSLFIGVVEVAAALGLTLPGILRIQPRLVALAAAGLVPLMAGAAVLHAQRGETSGTVITASLLAMAASVAYLRWRVIPIASRVGA